MKEGPYDWVPPSYWYSSRYDPNDSTRTNAGGAWAFDSEYLPTHAETARWLAEAT